MRLLRSGEEVRADDTKRAIVCSLVVCTSFAAGGRLLRSPRYEMGRTSPTTPRVVVRDIRRKLSDSPKPFPIRGTLCMTGLLNRKRKLQKKKKKKKRGGDLTEVRDAMLIVSCVLLRSSSCVFLFFCAANGQQGLPTCPNALLRVPQTLAWCAVGVFIVIMGKHFFFCLLMYVDCMPFFLQVCIIFRFVLRLLLQWYHLYFYPAFLLPCK